jgi:hypothetical protein
MRWRRPSLTVFSKSFLHELRQQESQDYVRTSDTAQSDQFLIHQRQVVDRNRHTRKRCPFQTSELLYGIMLPTTPLLKPNGQGGFHFTPPSRPSQNPVPSH